MAKAVAGDIVSIAGFA